MGGFKLGKMTLSSIFKKPETVQYPVQTKEAPAGLKGHIAIEIDNCIFCSMCAKACPTNAIVVNRDERTWSIDYLQCVQCFNCTFACRKDCLHMETAFPQATTTKGKFVAQSEPVATE